MPSSDDPPSPWDDTYPADEEYERSITSGRQLFRWLLMTQSWYQKYCALLAGPGRATAVLRRSLHEKTQRRHLHRRDSRVSLTAKFSSAKLDSAWAYYEHVVLPRHRIPGLGHPVGNRKVDEEEEENDDDGAGAAATDATVTQKKKTKADERPIDVLPRAKAGERQKLTRLYQVWATNEEELGDFGIGVGLYFYTLKCLSIIMFLGGLLSFPVLKYYASPEYNTPTDENPSWTVLQTSAICTDTKWVPCPSCGKTIKDSAADSTREWFTFDAITNERYATAISPTTGEQLYFLRNNLCEVNHVVAYFSYATMIFVSLAVVFMQAFLLKRRARKLDEATQTSTDYSIEIENPPLNARDPKEWKDFLEERFGHVTAVTVALDNEELVNALLKRRKYMAQLEQLIPKESARELLRTGRIVDIPGAVAVAKDVPWYSQYLLGSPTAGQLQKHIEVIEDEITRDGGLAHQEYHVSNVFVTFEHEKSQQDALAAFDVPGIDIWLQRPSSPDTPLFRDTTLNRDTVLQVREPPEPSSVRWKDLDEDWKVRLTQRSATIMVTAICMALGCAVVTTVRYYFGIAYAALAVTALNSGAPTLFGYLVATESHSSQGDMQSSLFSKNTVFLWFNTAIVSALITPFVRTLQNTDDALIPAMLAVFITEMFKTPVTQLLDVYGQFQRFVLGPLAPDQKRMNAYFQGTAWQLAERYTNMTTVLFLTFYYALLFPAGYFFAAVTLTAHYWTDKYCLLRYWAPAPVMGTAVANMSNIYFMIALAVYATISAYNFSSFPYDNSCESNSAVDEKYVGSYQGTAGTGDSVNIHVVAGDHEYFFCSQDMLRSRPPIFPPSPENQPEGSQWMTEEQQFAEVYAWTSAAIVAGLVFILFYNSVVKWVWRFFLGKREQRADVSTKGFTQIEDIFGYVPQARLACDPFPVLLCDVSRIERELVGWNDPNEINEMEHNAIYDLDTFEEADQANLFSTVMHWPVHKTEDVKIP